MSETGYVITEHGMFPLKDAARLLKYLKSFFSISLSFLLSLSRSELFFNFENRASFFLGGGI